MRGGSDMPRMLKMQMKVKIDSWAIRWCFEQFLKDLLTAFPSTSKVLNIGFGVEATHTKNTGRFNTTLDNTDKKEFSFEKNMFLNKKLIKEFRKEYSFINRLKYKIK